MKRKKCDWVSGRSKYPDIKQCENCDIRGLCYGYSLIKDKIQRDNGKEDK